MASSSAGAIGVGSAISLITVQNSGSDGRKGAVAARLRSALFGFAAAAIGKRADAGKHNTVRFAYHVGVVGDDHGIISRDTRK